VELSAAEQDRVATTQFAFAGAWRPAHSAQKQGGGAGAGANAKASSAASTDSAAAAPPTASIPVVDPGDAPSADATSRATLAARFDIDLSHLSALRDAAGGDAEVALGYLHLLVPKGSMRDGESEGDSASSSSGGGSLVVPFDPFTNMDELTHTVRGMRERDRLARVPPPRPLQHSAQQQAQQVDPWARSNPFVPMASRGVVPMSVAPATLYGPGSLLARQPRDRPVLLPPPPPNPETALHFASKGLVPQQQQGGVGGESLAALARRRQQEEAQALQVAQELLGFRPPVAAGSARQR